MKRLFAVLLILACGACAQTDIKTQKVNGIRIFSVASYGAIADGGLTDNTGPFNNAINAAFASGGGTVFIPAATTAYTVSSASIVIKKGVTLQCASNQTVINNKVGGTVPVLITTSSGNGGQLGILGCQIQPRNSGDIGIQILGVDHATVADNIGYCPSAGNGTFIQVDSNNILGAYTNRIDDNLTIGTNCHVGLELKASGGGATTSTVVRHNHLLADIPLNDVAGAADVFEGNLFQQRIVGTGNCILLGSSSVAEKFYGDYLEGCLVGIDIASGSANHQLSNPHWDNVTTHIKDNNPVTAPGCAVVISGEDGNIAFGSCGVGSVLSVTGDSQATRPPKIRVNDVQAAGKEFSFASGTCAIGSLCIGDDTAGTFPAIYGSGWSLLGGLGWGGGTALPTSNSTGIGNIVRANTPTLVTPTLGVASATSVCYGAGVCDTAGAGVPAGVCVTGSTYRNTTGGALTTFYVCEAAAWAAK